MINQRKQTCWMMRSRDLGNAENSHCRSLKIQIKKDSDSGDDKSLVLQLDCTCLTVYLPKFVAVQLRHVCMCSRNPRKKVNEKKGTFLINSANIATSYFICHFYSQHASVVSITVYPRSLI